MDISTEAGWMQKNFPIVDRKISNENFESSTRQTHDYAAIKANLWRIVCHTQIAHELVDIREYLGEAHGVQYT